MMRTVPLIALAAAGVLVVACDTGPDRSSGISGHTIVDGGCPVLQETGPPCPDQPLAAQITVSDPTGKPHAETTSNERGEFRLDLPPGEYILTPTNLTGTPLPYASPEKVTVRDGDFTVVQVKFESGVR